MLKKIKLSSLKKRKEKNLEQRDFSEVNAPLRTLGFLVNENEFQDFERLYDFSKGLGILRKDVKVFSFLESLPSLRNNQIYNKDFSWSGEITNQNAREFLEMPFDVLVGLYEEKNVFLDLLVSTSNAKFKVGCKGSDERLFDLIIQLSPTAIGDFETELKKYLKILNKI